MESSHLERERILISRTVPVSMLQSIRSQKETSEAESAEVRVVSLVTIRRERAEPDPMRYNFSTEFMLLL